jgi:hypothetical protein
MKSFVFVDYENKCQSFVSEGVRNIEAEWGEHPPVHGRVSFYHSYEPGSRQVPKMLREKAWLEEQRVTPGRNMVDKRLKRDVIDFCYRHQYDDGEDIQIFVVCGGDKGYRNLAKSCALPIELVVIEVPCPRCSLSALCPLTNSALLWFANRITMNALLLTSSLVV